MPEAFRVSFQFVSRRYDRDLGSSMGLYKMALGQVKVFNEKRK